MKTLAHWFIVSLVMGLSFAATMPQIAAAQGSYTCPTSSGYSYSAGGAYQHDMDNPVRPAWNHADKNLEDLRGYVLGSDAGSLVTYGGSTDPTQPPQLATLFSPGRVPSFTAVYKVYNWNWQPSPNPGTRGSLITTYPVTTLGMATTPGEPLVSPTHARNLGSPWGTGGAMVIFADEDSVTLHFTRDDSAAPGYTVHVDNICTDPNLLALYNQLDNADRNSAGSGSGNVWRDGVIDYNLPGLTQGKVFGTARGTEIRVAIVDSGSFMDPRSQNDWWQIRPAPPAILPPSPVSPANNANLDNPVTLTWTSVSNAVSYKIQLDDDAAFGSPLANTSVAATSFPAPALTQGKTYYWRVRAYNGSTNSAWSLMWSFKINAAPPLAVPNLASPASGAQVTSPVTLQWDPVNGATSYKVQVDDNSDFSSPKANVTITPNSYSAGGLSNGVTHFWRVRSKNATGTSAWSAVRTFTVGTPSTPPPSSVPTLVGPANGSSAGTPITFSWNAVSGAVSYKIQIDDNADFSSPVVNIWISNVSYTTSALSAGKTFYWRVRSKNAAGVASAWSAAWSVAVQ